MLRIGAVIEVNGQKYRVIEIKNDSIMLIEMGVAKYHFLRVDRSEVEKYPSIDMDKSICHPSDFMVMDRELKLIRKKEEAIQLILKGLNDISDLGKKKKIEGIEAYMRTFGVSRQTTHKDIRKYLQSGMDMLSLRDGRSSHGDTDMFSGKRGGRRFADGSIRVPVNPELEKRAFEEGFRMLGPGRSLRKIIIYLDRKYLGEAGFSDDGTPYIKMPPRSKSFSEKRFRRYCSEKIGKTTIPIYKKVIRDQRTTERSDNNEN